MSKTRCFTITNFAVDFDYNKLVPAHARYFAYGDEVCPKTGRAHHQGWVYFANPRTVSGKGLKAIIALMGGNGHAEPMYGSLASNDAYCSKMNAGVLKEFGERPAQGTRADLKDVVERIQRGEDTSDNICLSDPGYYHQYGRTLQKAEDIILRKRFRTEMTQGIWYWGGTGVGKSHTALQGYNPETHYLKPLQDDWWDGYTGQETVILNEFRGQIQFSELLSLVDKWPHYVKRRNREPAPFLAKTLIVTSALPPEDVYMAACSKVDNIAQLGRRFRIIKMEQKSPEGNTGTSVPKSGYRQIADVFRA